MTADDLKLRDLLVNVLLIEEAQYRDTLGPDEVATWDSVAMVEIAMAVEERFGYALEPDELVTLRSIGDIKSILASRGIAFVDVAGASAA